MVDHTNGGVWHKINYPDLTPRYPKVHLWKNGYHSFEHALIGYITCQVPDDYIGSKIGSLLRAREVMELLVATSLPENAQ